MDPVSQTQAGAPPYHLICLDPGRPFSTIHGDRHPDDPHYRAAYQQNGLFFDINQKLVPPDGKTAPYTGMSMEGKPITYSPLYPPQMLELIERRLKRISGSPLISHVEEEEAKVDPEEQIPETDVVNLGEWLRGTKNYPTNAVYDKIHRDYFTRCANIPDAVLLVFKDMKKKGLIQIDQVAQKWMQFLEKVE
jgi:hypothetical protein